MFHCKFPTQYELCMTFIRIQEFYESPKFRNKSFTLEEYIDWYCSQSENGAFTYMTDWEGFNVPSNVLHRAFREFQWTHGELRPREEKLKEALYRKAKIDVDSEDEEPYYIIGTTEDSDLETVRHEIAHGFFYLDQGYRRDVTEAIKKCKLTGLKKKLLKMGYHKAVVTDECHAYTLTGLEEGMRETKEIKSLRKKLKAIEKKHIGDKQ